MICLIDDVSLSFYRMPCRLCGGGNFTGVSRPRCRSVLAASRLTLATATRLQLLLAVCFMLFQLWQSTADSWYCQGLPSRSRNRLILRVPAVVRLSAAQLSRAAGCHVKSNLIWKKPQQSTYLTGDCLWLLVATADNKTRKKNISWYIEGDLFFKYW